MEEYFEVLLRNSTFFKEKIKILEVFVSAF
jgi:hypothetical protein